MRTLRTLLAASFAVFGATSFASELVGPSEQGQSFASGTPMWVLGFAVVIALVFLLIPVCAILFKSGETVEED